MGTKTNGLDERLSLIYELAPVCSRAVDVGTDHGLLICALAENNKIKNGIASDINPLPLRKAENEIYSRNLCDRLETRLTDGLNGIDGNDIDLVIIAGMGGETISKIISEWNYRDYPDITYILQPMTKPEILRRDMWNNGFETLEEQCASAGGHEYCVMKMRFAGAEQNYMTWETYSGRIRPDNDENRAYLKGLYDRLERICAARKDNDKELADAAAHIREVLEGLA